MPLEAFRQTYVRRVLRRCNGDFAEAARILGVTKDELKRYAGEWTLPNPHSTHDGAP